MIFSSETYERVRWPHRRIRVVRRAADEYVTPNNPVYICDSDAARPGTPRLRAAQAEGCSEARRAGMYVHDVRYTYSWRRRRYVNAAEALLQDYRILPTTVQACKFIAIAAELGQSQQAEGLAITTARFDR